MSSFFVCKADEGMWIPILLKKYTIEQMQSKGFKLTAEDIYSINHASLKDAIVGLGIKGQPFHHFCSAELISNNGLMITNHHCSFDMIQKHSTIDRNYLKDGFWAMSNAEELANPGITASILVRMEDVTNLINKQINSNLSEKEKIQKINLIVKEIVKKTEQGTNLRVSIKPYFNGNQYFMSVFKIYKDVRLVGAPPSAIGKFGGDTDNWMWPRHTGDFSMLRIYANSNNEPARYSPNNKPYVPVQSLKISTKDLNKGDFTMVFGYPGTTNEYLTSFAIDQTQNIANPAKIAIRTAKLNIINNTMASNDLLRIMYASKAASVANSWKRWKGEIQGLKRFNTIKTKQKLEDKFVKWSMDKPKYKNLVSNFAKLYKERKDIALADAYIKEAAYSGAEIIRFVSSFMNTIKALDFKKYDANKDNIINATKEFYKNFDLNTDKKIMMAMLNLYKENMSEEWTPELFNKLNNSKDINNFVDKTYSKSIFSNRIKFSEFVKKSSQKSLNSLAKDPIVKIVNSILDFRNANIKPKSDIIDAKLHSLNKLWIQGLMEMMPEKHFYPDANSTLRIAYGEIGGYEPKDGIEYKYYTTLKGIMEKDNPNIYDYNVPQKLRDLYAAKDFGNYTQNGEVPICFLASNHTTGGNSGSPVLNDKGELIGINFDRAWDGVMSDMEFNESICRNIAIDIRFALFIIDKFAGDTRLIDEMNIVNE